MRLTRYLHYTQANGPVSWPCKLRPNLALAASSGMGGVRRPAPCPALCSLPPLCLVPKGKARSRARILYIILAALAVFLLAFLIFPALALAWGPGAHMVTGNWVLQNLAGLPPAAAEALMRYPGQYLHGSLAADIFIGKGSKAKEGHSHNWASGFSLLDKADNLRRRAYALGYLSHLAADTVAHNVYVPGTFRTAPGSGRLAHVYIELYADSSLKWDKSDARGVFHEAGSSASERILRATIRQKAWQFWLKKHLYEHSIGLGASRALRRSMLAMDRLFPGYERLGMLEYMLTLSTRGIVSVLRDLDASPVLSLDPIGADAISLAVTRQSGRGLIIGSIRNIVKKPGVISPDMHMAAPLPQEVNIVVPEIMQDFPQVCVAGSFTGTQAEQE